MCEYCKTLSSGCLLGGKKKKKSISLLCSVKTQVCFNSNVKFHLTHDVTRCFHPCAGSLMFLKVMIAVSCMNFFLQPTLQLNTEHS